MAEDNNAVTAIRPRSTSPGNEVGDIVGADGYVELLPPLPPYSRYADDAMEKGATASIDRQISTMTEQSAAPLPIPPAQASGSDAELMSGGTQLAQNEVALREGLTEKRRMKLFCGSSTKTVLIVVVIAVCAAVIGGVIGGVVGNQTGQEEAEDAAAAATTTVV